MSDKQIPIKSTPREEVLKELSVEGSEEQKVAEAMMDGEPKPVRVGGTVIYNREPCLRQVFVNEEVAMSTAFRLKKRAIVERCSVCGMIHIKEL